MQIKENMYIGATKKVKQLLLANKIGQNQVKHVMQLVGNLVADREPDFSSVGTDGELMDNCGANQTFCDP